MYKVLVVDDEPIVKIALRSIITWETYGYTICATASDGIEALRLKKDHQPDLIITDLKMPNMDGLSLIKELKKQSYQGEILVLSNYEDFDFVRSALVLGAADYLLKISIQEKTLIQYLEKITNKLSLIKNQSDISEQYTRILESQQTIKREQLLKDYFENRITDLPKESKTLFDNFNQNSYSLCYINLEENNLKHTRMISQDSVHNALLEVFGSLVDCEILHLNQSNILIFIPSISPDSQKILLITYLQKLLSLFQLYFSISPMLIYEDEIREMDNLKQWYLTFLKITELRFYEELTVIKAIEYLPLHYINFTYYKDLAEELQKNHEESTENNTEIIFSIIETSRKLHILPEVLKIYFEKTIEMLEYLNHNLTLQTHEYLMELKEKIKLCNKQEELLSLITLALKRIFKQMEDKSETLPYKVEIIKALEYINNNYNKKMNLSGIADYVSLSSGYLCRLFKSEVGISLTNYINELRMKKAMELIRNQEKDTSLKEIALSIGIEDQLYFSRLFRKYYGIAPSEYKMMK